MINQRAHGSAFVGVLIYVLIGVGALMAGGGVAFGILTLLSPPTAGPSGFAALSMAMGFVWMAAGGMIGLLCFSIAAVLSLLADQGRRSVQQRTTVEQLRTAMQSLEVALRMTPAANAGAGATRAPAAAAPHAGWEEGAQPLLLDLLEQVRDSALMNDAQRRQLGAIHWAKRKSTLTESIERHMLSGNWAAAQAQLVQLQALLPDDPDVKTLAERVTGEYTARLADDLHAAHSQLRHLLSITAWPEANELVAALENKYPQAPEIEQMRLEINRERDTFERENRERILGELADATDRKQWGRAALAAEEFIQRYPLDKLAERLRVDLATLHENAQTQERKEQELLFKDLLKRQRYEEAVAVAKGVIARHPNSPAAAELTKLLPKVEELVHQHHAAATA